MKGSKDGEVTRFGHAGRERIKGKLGRNRMRLKKEKEEREGERI